MLNNNFNINLSIYLFTIKPREDGGRSERSIVKVSSIVKNMPANTRDYPPVSYK